MFKSGFVGIIGRPNAGKSTLLNSIVGSKVAIIADKPQTTRNIIRGVKTDENSQIIFMDTPGIHKPQHELGKRMNVAAYNTLNGADIIYYIFDVTAPFGSGDEFVINQIKTVNKPVFLLLNKSDLIEKENLLPLIDNLNNQYSFTEIIPISALNNDNIDLLLKVTKNYLNDNIQYYPTDQVSDYPEQFIIAEIIREKVISLTEEEIPHSIAVTIEKIKKKRNTLVINALVFVERDSQKGIIIGKNGQMIKEIGQQARLELEKRFATSIYLEIFVKVEKNWRNKAAKLQSLGYVKPELD